MNMKTMKTVQRRSITTGLFGLVMVLGGCCLRPPLRCPPAGSPPCETAPQDGADAEALALRATKLAQLRQQVAETLPAGFGGSSHQVAIGTGSVTFGGSTYTGKSFTSLENNVWTERWVLANETAAYFNNAVINERIVIYGDETSPAEAQTEMDKYITELQAAGDVAFRATFDFKYYTVPDWQTAPNTPANATTTVFEVKVAEGSGPPPVRGWLFREVLNGETTDHWLLMSSYAAQSMGDKLQIEPLTGAAAWTDLKDYLKNQGPLSVWYIQTRYSFEKL